MQKLTTIGPAGVPRQRGEISCSYVFQSYFFVISCAALENIFWKYRHHFCVKRVPVGIDFLGDLNFKIKNFPFLNPQNMNFRPVFGGTIFGQKRF